MELTARVFEGVPYLLIEVAIALFERAHARIQVILPEGIAEPSLQSRETECPDPPCHEVMRFEFAVRPEIKFQYVPVRVLAQADNGEERHLSLMTSIGG